jgi:hypothetical protein
MSPRARREHADDRRRFRSVLQAMCAATPDGGNPCAGWNADYWDTLEAITPPFEDTALLETLFRRARGDIQALDPRQRAYLEDVFVGGLRSTQPEKAATWIQQFERDERNWSASTRRSTTAATRWRPACWRVNCPPPRKPQTRS